MIYAPQNRGYFPCIQMNLDGCDFNIWLSDDISNMQMSCGDPEQLARNRIIIMFLVLRTTCMFTLCGNGFLL